MDLSASFVVDIDSMIHQNTTVDGITVNNYARNMFYLCLIDPSLNYISDLRRRPRNSGDVKLLQAC